MKTVIVIPLFCILVGQCVAQNTPITKAAVDFCSKEDWTSAQETIARALNTEESKDPYCWYVDGYIHKEIYKLKETGQPQSLLRLRAVDSFMKALEMDDYGKHTKMTKLGLKYLASTYYNDALMLTQTFKSSTENDPISLFGKFMTIMEVADPRTGVERFTAEFERNMGQRYYQLWTEDLNNNALPEKIIQRYKRVIAIDSTDTDAWYNLSVIYYNQAVFKYRLLDSKTDIFDLVTIQQECSDLISKMALPAMTKAYQLQPEKGEVVRGMMYIHRALEHEKDTDFFKQEVSRLIREGKIGSIVKQP